MMKVCEINQIQESFQTNFSFSQGNILWYDIILHDAISLNNKKIFSLQVVHQLIVVTWSKYYKVCLADQNVNSTNICVLNEIGAHIVTKTIEQKNTVKLLLHNKWCFANHVI